MKHYLPVITILGLLCMIFSLMMGGPILYSLIQGDAGLEALSQGALITFICGFFLFISFRKYKRELQPRDGFLLVTSTWTLLPVFGALPLMLFMPDLSFTDAYFEAMSGLTTTGSTVLVGLDDLPHSINVWRCLMVLIGGMGILVLAVAILPLIGVGGSQIYRAETPGPMKDEKLTPRITDTARGLWITYFVISMTCFISYGLAGMSWVDAFMHMCSTMGLGGFSSHDASFGHFNSLAIESVANVFMLLAGVNFGLYFVMWRRRRVFSIFQDVEARWFFITVFVSVFVIAIYLVYHGVYTSFGEALRHSAFNVISIATTTGFASVDYALWPIFAPILMLILCCFATCAGSTGGGIKMIRAILVIKQARNELLRCVHPHIIKPVRLAHNIVDDKVMQSIFAFLLIYIATITVTTLLMLVSGADIITATTAVIASINNTGPGLGEVGPASNYQSLSDFQTWICSFLMLAGRLELLSVFVLLTPQFWRR
ncbi:MAG: TrkH family potassium uptake protein [Burkholderiales bacterium]|nr:TrkH family potassium uptake protein [Burkholderiales bacterium]